MKLYKYEDAKVAFEQACVLDPTNSDAIIGNAIASRNVGALEEATELLKEAMLLRPESVTSRSELAHTLIELNRADEAKLVLDDLPAHVRETVRIDTLYAEIFAAQGDFDAANRVVTQALERSPDNSAALLLLSKIDACSNLLSNPNLYQKLENPSSTFEEKRDLGFALGRSAEARGDYDAAFLAYQRGNEAQNSLAEAAVGAYSVEDHERLIDRTMKIYSHERVAALARYGVDDGRPIFIVGMPRSGTTLIEQILSAHPDVFGAGERQALADVKSYFEKVAVRTDTTLAQTVPEAFFRRATELYFSNLANEATQCAKFTDKNPHNFLLIGLIRILMPRARIIHCRRNRLDTCISNYFQVFSHRHNYCNRLDDLAHYYRQYLRLFNYWNEYQKDDIFEIEYESLIEQPEHNVRNLLQFCGLSWNESCLAFYKNSRLVYTPSQMQVRKPIYTSSVGRWQHYKKFLTPLMSGPDAISQLR
ncbi:tetratricopeptide repeat-containing sulfotransferase family protein [Hyphococcus sp. DH-69]|uniref:tetratricopeptide repeat-containing sulfotransferase family protein n=1 Tax=Hyphococcus formosus TaxID=3143534 RepID=UPI00398B2913